LEIFLGPDPAPGQPVEHQQDWISRTGVKKSRNRSWDQLEYLYSGSIKNDLNKTLCSPVKIKR